MRTSLGIESGTLEFGTISRKIWRKAYPKSSMGSEQTDLTMQEFLRPWRVLRLAKNKQNTRNRSLPEDDSNNPMTLENGCNILHHYEPNFVPAPPLFPTELREPSCFRDVTAIEGSAAYRVTTKLSFNLGIVRTCY